MYDMHDIPRDPTLRPVPSLLSSAPAPSQISTTVIYGLVKHIHARNAVLTKTPGSHDTICDIGKLKPVARLGGNQWGSITEGYEADRPAWKDVQVPGSKA